MTISIDLNADLGEGFAWENDLLDLVTSASISCGAHAGDDLGLKVTLSEATRRGVVIGAHPSYPDPVHFGRREWDLRTSALEIARMVELQVVHFQRLGAVLHFVKPHGALYNQAQRVESIAEGLVAAILPYGWPILGLAGGWAEKRCTHAGLRFVQEGFADRRYGPDGQLVPRSQEDAVLDDPREIADQVLALVDRGIETICLHGDQPNSVEIGQLVRRTLEGAGVTIRPFLNQ